MMAKLQQPSADYRERTLHFMNLSLCSMQMKRWSFMRKVEQIRKSSWPCTVGQKTIFMANKFHLPAGKGSP